MRVKLTYIERNFRNEELSKREEILEGESSKSSTRKHVAKLIARHHPELKSAGTVFLINSSETGYKWYVRANRKSNNCWVYVYADPLDGA